MDRRDVLALSGALTVAALAGCVGDESDDATGDSGDDSTDDSGDDSTGEGSQSNGNGDSDGDPNDEPGDEPTGDPDVDDERLAELAAGNAAFALDLHEYIADEQGGTQFFSPYSISAALAMTFAGARGEAREQMRDTLRYTLDEDVHPAFADLEAALDARTVTEDPLEGEEVDAFQLQVANQLWGSEEYPFDDEYLTLVEEYYGAGLNDADFAGDSEGERERINQWVADATEDRIEDLLPPNSLSPATVLVLTNAIYFMASWAQEFDPADTEDGTFTALDGSASTVPFMHQNIRTGYADLPRAEAVELPYVGEEVSMVLILPDEGEFEAFERDLDAGLLFGIFEELGDGQGDLAMPQFEIETEVQLREALSALGMPDAFGPDANFGGMVDGGGGPGIDEVYHDAVVTVDEQGTEAAAATAVVMDQSAPPQWGELRFDRPFLFCIRDRPTDAVLFLGRVVDL